MMLTVSMTVSHLYQNLKNIMNTDEGAYQLSPIWTQVISTPKPGGGGGGRASTE